MNANQSDRRREERVYATVDVSQEAVRDFYVGVAGEVGYGRVSIGSEQPPPHGSPVQLTIKLPGGALVRSEGCVQWVRLPSQARVSLPAGYGVTWQAREPASVEALRRYVYGNDDTLVMPVV